MDLTQGGSSTGQKFQKDINKTEKLEKKLTRRPIKIHMLGQEGCQEFQLNEQKCEERVKKVNKNKKSREAKKQETWMNLLVRKQGWRKCWRLNRKTGRIPEKNY